MKNLKTKIKGQKTLLTLVGIPVAVGMIAFGCSPERLEESKKPKIEYPGMPPYDTSKELPDINVLDYVESLLRIKKASAKKGPLSKIPLDGEVVSLKTVYGYGVPEKAEKDERGEYTAECTHIIRHKELRKLNPKELSKTPLFSTDGKITVVEYDYGLDKKIDARIIIQEKYVEGKDVVKTQELDIGADGTIEERLITSPYEGYTFEKALE